MAVTVEEFKKREQEEEDWAPGWDLIEEAFSKRYPGEEPAHFGTNLQERALFGGNQYLDGYSIYQSSSGQHIVTFGMTELYANEEALGGEWNKWGYEMTIRLAEERVENCMWAIDMLSNLARYTYTKERYFEPFQYVAGNGSSICLGRDSKITALMLVPDTEIPTVHGIYGETAFIQLVGITEQELKRLKENPENIKILYDLMRKDNPNLITDLNRVKEYL